MPIRAAESLTTDFVASGVIAYLIEGSGATQCFGERTAWAADDLLVLQGGTPALDIAGQADAVLWIVTNEPRLAFENLRAPAPQHQQRIRRPGPERGRLLLASGRPGRRRGARIMNGEWDADEISHKRSTSPFRPHQRGVDP
jgi:hypothetical protein